MTLKGLVSDEYEFLSKELMELLNNCQRFLLHLAVVALSVSV